MAANFANQCYTVRIAPSCDIGAVRVGVSQLRKIPDESSLSLSIGIGQDIFLGIGQDIWV